MPLPLVVGIGIAVASAAGAGVSMLKMRRDKKRYDDARSIYERYADGYRDFVARVNNEIDELHNQRVDAQGTLREAADFLVRANVKERTFDAEENVIPWKFAELRDVIERLSSVTIGLAGGAAGGAALGASAAAGAYTAAGAFGTASTGAAISGLVGVAARNATLAWLGGGSLLAGGGGMAAGVAALAGIALTPIAVVPAVVSVVKAVRQGKRIESEIEKMDVSRAEMEKHGAELTAILNRVREMSKSIREVETALKNVLASASAESLEDVYRVASAAKTLAQLLDLDGASKPDSGDAPDAGTGSPIPRPTPLSPGPANVEAAHG